MNIVELEKILIAEEFNTNSYSLFSENRVPDEALCLRKEDSKWIVFYSERGLKTDKRLFQSEAEACLYVLESQRSDPTVKVGWKSGFSMP
jgi:hypothetical protein